MSKSALAVAAALVALALTIALFTRRDAPPAVGPAPGPAEQIAPPSEPSAVTPARPPAGAGTATPAGQSGPRIASRDDLAQVLNARGLDGERLIREYQAWRVARGFLGPEPLAGVSADDAPAATYATMDERTLKQLADGNDLAAIQGLGAALRASDPAAALKQYQRAINLGSIAAVMDYAEVLKNMRGAPASANELLQAEDGDAARDPRGDVLALGLAAIRSGGPAVADAGQLMWLTATARQMSPEQVTAACARSLAILAEVSAAQAAQGTAFATGPPVFVTEPELYQRLPCGDTAAPVTPLQSASACEISSASDAAGRPVELWICEGN